MHYDRGVGATQDGSLYFDNVVELNDVWVAQALQRLHLARQKFLQISLRGFDFRNNLDKMQSFVSLKNARKDIALANSHLANSHPKQTQTCSHHTYTNYDIYHAYDFHSPHTLMATFLSPHWASLTLEYPPTPIVSCTVQPQSCNVFKGRTVDTRVCRTPRWVRAHGSSKY